MTQSFVTDSSCALYIILYNSSKFNNQNAYNKKWALESVFFFFFQTDILDCFLFLFEFITVSSGNSTLFLLVGGEGVVSVGLLVKDCFVFSGLGVGI